MGRPPTFREFVGDAAFEIARRNAERERLIESVPDVRDLDAITISGDGQTITIDGIRYSRALFRALSFGPLGAVFRVVEREGGLVTVETLRDGRVVAGKFTPDDGHG